MLALDARVAPFEPPRWARGGHAQTLLAHFAPSPRLPGWGLSSKESAFSSDGRLDEKWIVPVSGGDRVVAHYFAPHADEDPSTLVYLFHGLGGESHGSYMQRAAMAGLDLGFGAVIANHRGCGEGMELAVEPYHSGRAEDLGAVVAEGRRRFPRARHIAVGFSLSGNAVLLLAAGERADKNGVPDAAMSVNAPIELALASRAISHGINRVYDINFMIGMRAAAKARAERGGPAPRSLLSLNWRSTLWDFDQAYTAPASGFADRDDYYQRCSAFTHLANLRVPTVMLTSEDDPIVPVASYRRARLADCAFLRIERHGGHMGYFSARPTPFGTRRWLDWAIAEYVSALDRRVQSLRS